MSGFISTSAGHRHMYPVYVYTDTHVKKKRKSKISFCMPLMALPGKELVSDRVNTL